jgi:integrase
MSPRNRGARVRLWENVYSDDAGIAGVARAAGKRKELRFPHGTGKREILEALEEARRELRKAAKRQAQALREGTLAGDVAAYLDTLPEGQAKKSTRSNLAAWLPALGERPRAALTVEELRKVVRGWLEAGVAASTLNHRRRELINLWEHFDGEEAECPARRLKRQRPPEREPRALPMPLLEAIIAGMPERRVRRRGRKALEGPSYSKARLWLMLWTGIAPATMARLHPRAFDLEAGPTGELALPARRKGKGAKAVTLPLVAEARPAVRLWLRLGAHGRFSTSSLAKAFARAARAYQAKREAAGQPVSLPPDLSPYVLRHSFLTWLARKVRDPLLVQRYAQHADLKTTAQYIEAALSELMTAAIVGVAPEGGPRKAGRRQSVEEPALTFPEGG